MTKTVDTTTNKETFVESPEAVMREVLAINREVQKHPKPKEPALYYTPKETVERHGAPLEVAAVSTTVGVVGGLSTTVFGLMSVGPGAELPLSIAFVIMALILGGVGLGVFTQTKLFGKFWARVVRKKHYLELHEKARSEEEITQKAYEQALAKRQKVMKRLKKRAKPVIDAYNTQESLKQLEFSAKKGLVIKDRYKPDEQVALGVVSGIFDNSAVKELEGASLKSLSASSTPKSVEA